MMMLATTSAEALLTSCPLTARTASPQRSPAAAAAERGVTRPIRTGANPATVKPKPSSPRDRKICIRASTYRTKQVAIGMKLCESQIG